MALFKNFVISDDHSWIGSLSHYTLELKWHFFQKTLVQNGFVGIFIGHGKETWPSWEWGQQGKVSEHQGNNRSELFGNRWCYKWF